MCIFKSFKTTLYTFLFWLQADRYLARPRQSTLVIKPHHWQPKQPVCFGEAVSESQRRPIGFLGLLSIPICLRQSFCVRRSSILDLPTACLRLSAPAEGKKIEHIEEEKRQSWREREKKRAREGSRGWTVNFIHTPSWMRGGE